MTVPGMDHMDVWGVVVAAGKGTRFGSVKHTARLAGKPLWQWARDALIESGARGVVVVGNVPGGVKGGAKRHLSVARGIDAVSPEATVIAVHDAARPLASSELIRRLYRALDESGADGVVPVVPIPDTLKQVDSWRRVEAGRGRVRKTIDRSRIACTQTPQVFRAEALRRAHAGRVRGAPSDDAGMVEAHGGKVVAVMGERAAMKITYRDDLALARAFLRRR